jgi:hypothetical protein
VEVKRASDTRIRREVVGQMFDYAANALLHWPLDTIRESFEATSRSKEQYPDSVVADLLKLPSEAEEEIEEYWTKVENNLKDGRLRLVFLADRIPAELRRIIEFLNEQMQSTEVLGVELPQFADDELKVITPRVIGQTTAAEKAKGKRTKGIQWDEPLFIKSLQENSDKEDVDVAAAIIDWVRLRKLRELWGKGKRYGSITPIYDDSEGNSHYLFRMNSSGSLELYFQWYQRHPPFDATEKRLELMDKLNDIPAIRLTRNDIARRPSVPLSIFRDEENLKALQSVFEWYIAQLDSVTGVTRIRSIYPQMYGFTSVLNRQIWGKCVTSVSNLISSGNNLSNQSSAIVQRPWNYCTVNYIAFLTMFVYDVIRSPQVLRKLGARPRKRPLFFLQP